jgi:hypothetical protein
LKKDNNSRQKSELNGKRAKSVNTRHRETTEVLAELVGRLREKLNPKKGPLDPRREPLDCGSLRPNIDRLTVGVDLGGRWSNYCILDLEGDKLAEGKLQTTQEDFAQLFKGLNASRVVIEVGTHSAGESQPQLGISKAGDSLVRKLLVGSAQCILGPFGPDTDLRRYGLRLCERGGKNAKKRAAVAVARKLAVLLHRLWVTGEVYEPLHHHMPLPAVTATAAA